MPGRDLAARLARTGVGGKRRRTATQGRAPPRPSCRAVGSGAASRRRRHGRVARAVDGAPDVTAVEMIAWLAATTQDQADCDQTLRDLFGNLEAKLASMP